jgi:nucleotidyltransferase substrate binding protein (TIGR01987 family)
MNDFGLHSLKVAFARYQEALLIRSDDLHRDGTIQRFEYTLELTWKTLKRVLEERGLEVNSPKETFRLAAKEKLIGQVAQWFDFVEKRNLASHVYREEYARAIEAVFLPFESAVRGVIETIESLKKTSP